MRTPHRFPAKHLKTTPKAWRQMKRQEWKQVMNALETFYLGCAYTPVSADLHEVQRLVRRMSDDLEGEWIAW